MTVLRVLGAAVLGYASGVWTVNAVDDRRAGRDAAPWSTLTAIAFGAAALTVVCW